MASAVISLQSSVWTSPPSPPRPPSLFFSFPPCVSDVVTINWRQPFCVCVWVWERGEAEAADGWCRCLSYHQLWLALSGSECWVHPNHFPGSSGAVGRVFCVCVCKLPCLLCISASLCVSLDFCVWACFYLTILSHCVAYRLPNHTRASGRLTGFRDCNSTGAKTLKPCSKTAGRL